MLSRPTLIRYQKLISTSATTTLSYFAQQVCGPDLNSSHSWYPCDAPEASSYSLVVFFEKPVVATAVYVYLASDGLVVASPPLISVELISDEMGSDGVPHFVQSRRVSCKANPVEITVMQDLSKPFRLTKSVRLNLTVPDVSIAAVRLRSSESLNPVAVSRCSSRQLYHPGL